MNDGFMWGGGFEILFILFFIAILIFMLVSFVKGMGEWGRNNKSPRLTVDAHVVSKRENVGNNGANSMTFTTYYVTFVVESGDRMELCVEGGKYGMLVQGDCGSLPFREPDF